MVLHPGDEDLVARLQGVAAPGLRHQVDALGAAFRKDDLATIRRVDEAGDRGARRFVGRGRALAEQVGGAMDVRVVVPVVVLEGVEHLPGLLRGVGVVEVD